MAFMAVAGTGCTHSEDRSVPERLQGNWGCRRSFRDGEFLRSDRASLEVIQTSLKYAYSSHWDCDSLALDPHGAPWGPCSADPPEDRSGYFEGVFKAVGDSLAVPDGTDTLSFRNLKAGSVDMVVNGLKYAMIRS